MEPSEEKERIIHVSGYVTKEDLEYIDLVKPKTIVHHTSANYNEKRKFAIPNNTKLLNTEDGIEFIL